ncbi:hypothetical protein [Streptomyces sp. NPDC051219]
MQELYGEDVLTPHPATPTTPAALTPRTPSPRRSATSHVGR